ncbi:hypothetical protein V490_06391 [Pseudogymnoascus sp. VKM F-3557]|nr:hypothetical protein V490_06391 [Pseudogymnoascus sp. VKM F-3557]
MPANMEQQPPAAPPALLSVHATGAPPGPLYLETQERFGGSPRTTRTMLSGWPTPAASRWNTSPRLLFPTVAHVDAAFLYLPVSRTPYDDFIVITLAVTVAVAVTATLVTAAASSYSRILSLYVALIVIILAFTVAVAVECLAKVLNADAFLGSRMLRSAANNTRHIFPRVSASTLRSVHTWNESAWLEVFAWSL